MRRHRDWAAVCMAFAAALSGGVAGGCGGAGGGSPQDAVSGFLEPWSRPPDLSFDGTPPEEVAGFWERLCEGVDPRIRRGLRLDFEIEVSEQAECGAVVATLVAYTGDTGQMAPPSRLSGDPLEVATVGDSSVATVGMRYWVDDHRSAAPAPPARARISALLVRRDGGWYVATPQAFNPLRAREGGFSDAELRAEHRRLLAAAQK